MRVKYLVLLVLSLFILLSIDLVDGKKKKKTKSAKDTVMSDIKDEKTDTQEQEVKEEKQPEPTPEVEDENSTIKYLEKFQQLHFYMKQDVFSLLFVYHKDNKASVEGLKELKKVEQKLRGYANFLVIGCHLEEFQNDKTPMCKKEADSGIFPLMSGMIPPVNRFNPYTKKVEDNTEIPYGTRPKTEKAISKFITSNIPNFVTSITKPNEYDSKMKTDRKINKVVLFSEKNIAPVLYKALATHFKDRLDFYFVDVTQLRKKANKLNITTFPTIIVHADFDTDGAKRATKETITYDGKNDIQDLINFITPFALENKYDPNVSDTPVYQKRSSYTFVNHKNYTKGIMDDYRAQVIFFDKSYESIKDKFESVAKKIHGPANVVFFNCQTDEAIKVAEEQFGVKKFPRILVFATGAEKTQETALEISNNNDSEDIVNIVTETEIKDRLKEVSDSVLSSIILNNAVQLRKVTLVYLYEGEGDAVPLSFKAVSTNPEFGDNFEFIALKNPGRLTMQQFQVPKLPVIIGGLPPMQGMETQNAEGQSSIQSMIYQGNINDYYELLDYNLAVLRMFYPKVEEEVKVNEREPEATVEFQEVTASNFDEICESKKGLCVIAFLDASIHSEMDRINHEEKLALLQERNKESSSQFKYMWINSTCHNYLLPKFELSQMFLPTLVIYSPGQGKYTRMVNTLTKENIIDFEKSFEGTGNTRIIVYDAPEELNIQDLDCPNIHPEGENILEEDNMMDKELEEEIMREILEEEQRKQQQAEEESEDDDGDSAQKKKKKRKGKKKVKKN